MPLVPPHLAACALALTATVALGREPAPVNFATDLAPILSERCLGCHTPGIEKGGLSLATAAGVRELGYVVPGDPDSSYLIDLISPSGDEPPEMPWEGPPLTADEVELFRRWVAEGADWPDEVVLREKPKADATWWSLQPVDPIDPPAVEDPLAGWEANPVDRFVLARIRESGLQPNGPADRRTLIRRATYDLTGLPPTPEEVEAFVSDERPDAYERLVDCLLASPHYGERWGRHWLDVVRFAESHGFEQNNLINTLWPFRDYIIESLNDDAPFDRVIREHLAGDVLADATLRSETASAFLVAGAYDRVGNQCAAAAARIRADTVDEIIRATGEAFLGLTVGCARCHDHKFDPVTQRDYYAWYATFAGVRHGDRVVATDEEKAHHAALVEPLEQKLTELQEARKKLSDRVLKRAEQRADEIASAWTRDPVRRNGVDDPFPPTEARFVRLVCEANDRNPESPSNFRVDEFEVWSAGPDPQNVALASAGAKATGKSKKAKDFAAAYGPHLAIDGEPGAQFIARGRDLTIELAAPTRIDRVFFSSAKGQPDGKTGSGFFLFVGEYRIEVSLDGESWRQVSSSHDRRPVGDKYRRLRLIQAEQTPEEATERKRLRREIDLARRELKAIPPLPKVWVGKRVESDEPFAVFVGGDPARHAEEVTAASLEVLEGVEDAYELPPGAQEAERRRRFADWVASPANPLTPRVLANRVWRGHFGAGIVNTPSDFGYMGERPTHPELLDWLADQLIENGWRLKPLHRLIMTSQAYRQASTARPEGIEADAESRLLWRFPPRRLDAEEIRDTMLSVAGLLDLKNRGGPGFRLYNYMQDNIATYEQLEAPGPETYRRAVYHQNARSAPTDLLTDFDQPDCTFTAPRRASTTTPLQALTLLNHQFTLDLAEAMAQRLNEESPDDPVSHAYQLCYSRAPAADELTACRDFAAEHGLPALCRVLLNTSELIDLR